jgi:hypothetical protein
MEAATRTARVIGLLIIFQMVGGVMVNFVLEAPLFGAPGFLVNAASHSRQLGVAALLGLISEVVSLGIAVAAFPIFWQRTRRMALWLFALAVVGIAVAVVENAGVMSMVSVSQAYATASAAQREHLESIRVVVASARNWPHYIARMFDGGMLFVFYAVLYRFALIPRALAGFGLVAVVLQVTAVAMPLLGHGVVFPMLAPLGLSQLALATWLLTKGFRPPEANVGPAYVGQTDHF